MLAQKFSQCRPILVDLASRGLHAAAEQVIEADSILIGVPAAQLLLRDDPALYPALADGFECLVKLGRVCAGTDQTPLLGEPGGLRRQVYHGLVLHLHLAAFNLQYERMPPEVWGACEDRLPLAVDPARQVEQYGDVGPPGDRIDLVLWQALCLLEQAEALGRDVDVELIDAVVHQAITQESIASGVAGAASLHPRNDCEALDLWTYRELCGLHALAHLALRRRNTNWARRVEQIALYHLEHTQPDHTTGQPWALFAFAWSRGTETYAQQQIRDATVYGAAERPNCNRPEHRSAGQDPGSGAVAAMLLADAAHAMLAFERMDKS